jgi:hypothetical protein
LNAQERTIYREIVRTAAAGSLANSDRMTVEVCAKLMHKLRSAETLPRSSELTLLLNTLSKLGMNPVDRARLDLSLSPEPKKENDPWDELLNQ